MAATTVGIDLGTTISVLAVSENGTVSFARTRDGGPRLRSAVAFSPGGAVVGEAAVRMAAVEPESSFAFFKRSMGTDWEVEVGERRLRPQDLSAEVLRALAADAAASFGAVPRAAVVTIPAYFGDDARRATKEAATLAEIEPLALLHEPTAACFANGAATSGTVLVYDLGGGTFDVSVVRHDGAGSEVLATLGDHRLGGKDWDDVMAELLVEGLDDGEDPREDPALLADLLERAHDAKHTLSRLPDVTVNVATSAGVKRVAVARDRFLERTAHLFAQTEEIVARVLDDVGGAGAVDQTLLVGGSTRMPPCAEIVERLSGEAPAGGVDPDEAVARGAAIAAAAHSEAGARYASRIRDVTAHALGFVVVSAAGDRYVNQVMITRNERIPASACKAHALEHAGSRGSLEVHMLQGDAERPLDNQPLGCWRFEGIAAGGRGPVGIEVAYEYDEDGVVQVSARADGQPLAAPVIDREDRDLRWTDEEPGSRGGGDVSVALVIDTSSSMSGRKLEEAKKALAGFVDVLEEGGLGDRIALVAFANSADRRARFGVGAKAVRKAASKLVADGATAMGSGLEGAAKELEEAPGRRVVVVLTDGAPTDGDAAMRVREQLVEDEVEIIARGVEGADLAFLERLATVDGEILDLAGLAGDFRGIARELAGGGGLRQWR
ncbi:MAG TPA: Hsp70 family protein [Solirubrobacterales bacterium]|nr:Hsp70 family protein [Solirubrobacterales bacterium]